MTGPWARLRWRWLLLALPLLLGACSLFLSQPTVSVKEVSLAGLDDTGVNLDLQLAVHNPNLFDLNLQGFRYDLRVLALPFAAGESREPVAFPGQSTTDVRLPVRVSYRDFLEVLKRRPDPDRVPYQLRGGLELTTVWGSRSLPLDASGTFAIPPRYRPSYLMQQVTDFFAP